jgi:hypothetical protein
VDDLLREVECDPQTLGLILHGSRAGGAERPASDFDLVRVVTDEAYQRGVVHEKRGNTDVVLQTPARLRRLAGNPGWWTASFLSAQVLVDKTGEVEPLVRAIVDAANDAAYAGVPEAYDGYLNSWVRSLKAWRKGDELGGRLHASQSAVYLLHALFGLERRWLPYLDALEQALPEIEAAQGWKPGYLRGAVLRLLDSGDPAFQRDLEARVEALLADRGFAHEWGDDLEPLKSDDA